MPIWVFLTLLEQIVAADFIYLAFPVVELVDVFWSKYTSVSLIYWFS